MTDLAQVLVALRSVVDWPVYRPAQERHILEETLVVLERLSRLSIAHTGQINPMVLLATLALDEPLRIPLTTAKRVVDDVEQDRRDLQVDVEDDHVVITYPERGHT